MPYSVSSIDEVERAIAVATRDEVVFTESLQRRSAMQFFQSMGLNEVVDVLG